MRRSNTAFSGSGAGAGAGAGAGDPPPPAGKMLPPAPPADLRPALRERYTAALTAFYRGRPNAPPDLNIPGLVQWYFVGPAFATEAEGLAALNARLFTSYSECLPVAPASPPGQPPQKRPKSAAKAAAPAPAAAAAGEAGGGGGGGGNQAEGAGAAEQLTLPLRYTVELIVHAAMVRGQRQLRVGVVMMPDGSQGNAAIVASFERRLHQGRPTAEKLPAEACGVIELMDTILAINGEPTPTCDKATAVMKDAMAKLLRSTMRPNRRAVTLALRSSYKTVPAWRCARCTTINPDHTLSHHHATAGMVRRVVEECEACAGKRGAP